jgi:acetyl-CoA acyltransferase
MLSHPIGSITRHEWVDTSLEKLASLPPLHPEIEGFSAAMCVATIRLLDLDPDRVNVNGSGCSLGHPVATTGARMLVTLVHELRRRGGGIGVAAMCAGGGMGSAAVIEVPAP